jgi:hypothetical protein
MIPQITKIGGWKKFKSSRSKMVSKNGKYRFCSVGFSTKTAHSTKNDAATADTRLGFANVMRNFANALTTTAGKFRNALNGLKFIREIQRKNRFLLIFASDTTPGQPRKITILKFR